jgi:hypothetical protein
MKSSLLMAVLASGRLSGRPYECFQVCFVRQSGKSGTRQPREILSPAIVRNGFTSFQIAIRTQAWRRARLAGRCMSAKSGGRVQITLYRRSGDKLERYSGTSGQGPRFCGWMCGPIGRRGAAGEGQPQLTGGGWVIYPMEARS